MNINKIDNLLVEMFQCKFDKGRSIRYQKYEDAASARDKERQLSEDLYRLIIGGDDFGYIKWLECEKVVDDYCKENYGFSYSDSDSLTQLKRQIALKNLGI